MENLNSASAPLYIQVFGSQELGLQGNIAAVGLDPQPLESAQMQDLARAYAQPATSFLSPGAKENHFAIRWFAPDAEIGLCGHGAMAAVVFLHQQYGLSNVQLFYPQGRIEGGFLGGEYYLFLEPIEVIDHLPVEPALEQALGLKVLDYFSTANKYIVVVESEAALAAMRPDFEALAKLEPFGYVLTAPGEHCDFVSRTLVPKVQQLEDHATGSSHAVLTPFWSERLGGQKMLGLQLSARGGRFLCSMQMNQVMLQGEGFILGQQASPN